MCAVTVTVLVVVVVLVVMVSAVIVLCECFALNHISFVVFHPLTTFEVKTRTIFEIFK